MTDKVCIKKGCNWTRTHGYFCQKHRVPERLVDSRPRCAAVGCYLERKNLTMFCGDHQMAMDRPQCYSSARPVEPFRAPLPDRKCNLVIDPKNPKTVDKLRVKWDGFQFVCTKTECRTVGFGVSPGAAIRDWILDDGIPF